METGETSDMIGLAGFALACFAAASSGGVFRPGAWYESIAKPSWRPPNAAFAPVWLVLFVMIAISGWLVWREAGFAGAPVALGVYAAQLVLNALWSAIFFGMRRIGLALAEMAVLWLSILATIVLFHPVDPLAAWLLVPYIAWVSIAFVLNASILKLNPTLPRDAAVASGKD